MPLFPKLGKNEKRFLQSLKYQKETYVWEQGLGRTRTCYPPNKDTFLPFHLCIFPEDTILVQSWTR